MRLLIQDNKKAWLVCAVSLGLAILSYILFPDWLPSPWMGLGMKNTDAEKTAIFFFPTMQAALLIVCDRKKTRGRCLRFRLLPRNKYQYHAAVLLITVGLLVMELGALYVSFHY